MRTSLLVASSLLLISCGGKSPPGALPVEAPPAIAPVPAGPTPVVSDPEPVAPPPVVKADAVTAAVVAETKAKLRAKSPGAGDRIDRGVDQAAKLWRAGDGDFAELCLAQFVAEPKDRDALFARMEAMVEQVRGHDNEVERAAKWGSEVEQGPILPVDELLASYDPGAHVVDDLFRTKVAFSVLLNFPLTTLADRIANADKYSRREWAEVRLASIFEKRIPGDLAAQQTAAEAAGDQYIAGYNLWMHHVLGEDGQRRFPSGKRLITHWNLRDELKANYKEPPAEGLAKQRTIAKAMERIVTQTIPAAVIDNPRLDWNPFTNTVTAAPAAEIEANAPANRATSPSEAKEPDARFQKVIDHFAAAKAIDKFTPTAPTYIERAFASAELPEARVRAMLVEILESPLGAKTGELLGKKLGRPLEPQDLWFPFNAGTTPEADLDALTRKRYPTAAKFEADIPRILRDLGFSAERAKYIAAHIQVDPSRGAGHAMEAMRRGDKAHLRTRVETGGMNYKGYNIAVHELGHNVEQTFSLYDVDHTLLQGVPNTAFTEALAFLFQARALELLGKPRPTGDAERLRVIQDFWDAREIAGSALVEMDVWHWLYEHPAATAAELRDATVKIARDTWNRYYAPILGGKDTALLGIYSHTITSPLYLFNYVVGHLIAFQVEEHLAGKDKATFGKEFERVTKIGYVLPDLWMTQATGKPVGTQSLLSAAAKALGN